MINYILNSVKNIFVNNIFILIFIKNKYNKNYFLFSI